jgi:hypothetical protein
MNIHAARQISCAGSRVNGKMASLVPSRTVSQRKPMNRTPHMQPTLTMGLAAQGIGSPCNACITVFGLLASAQADAQLGTTATQ